MLNEILCSYSRYYIVVLNVAKLLWLHNSFLRRYTKLTETLLRQHIK